METRVSSLEVGIKYCIDFIFYFHSPLPPSTPHTLFLNKLKTKMYVHKYGTIRAIYNKICLCIFTLFFGEKFTSPSFITCIIFCNLHPHKSHTTATQQPGSHMLSVYRNKQQMTPARSRMYSLQLLGMRTNTL